MAHATQQKLRPLGDRMEEAQEELCPPGISDRKRVSGRFAVLESRQAGWRRPFVAAESFGGELGFEAEPAKHGNRSQDGEQSVAVLSFTDRAVDVDDIALRTNTIDVSEVADVTADLRLRGMVRGLPGVLSRAEDWGDLRRGR